MGVGKGVGLRGRASFGFCLEDDDDDDDSGDDCDLDCDLD